MSDETQEFETCEACGASIYPEHLEQHTAERWEGKLLCPHCLKESRDAGNEVASELVSLVDDDKPRVVGGKSSRIQFSGGGLGAQDTEHKYQRILLNGPAATRCRTFHCKLTDASFGHINEQINEWADAHEDVAIKFATSSVGVVEGKHNDPHLIITVFY